MTMKAEASFSVDGQGTVQIMAPDPANRMTVSDVTPPTPQHPIPRTES